MSQRVLVIFGTRPEAIKMAPVVNALRELPDLRTRICVTAQHRQMLDQVLALFSLVPDYDLDLMQPGQTLTALTTSVLHHVGEVLLAERPQMVLVHGDTTTTFAAALAAFYAQIPVAHVEAGLRTHDLGAPWPEELNRQLASRIAALHYAPTAQARANLLHEGIPDHRIVVTGNTVIDALLAAVARVRRAPELVDLSFLDPRKRLLLVTGHRRENFGAGLDRVCKALARLAERSDVEIVYPVHLNPRVREPVHERLAHLPSIHLIPPQEYLAFVALMDRAHLIITDSGGIQEEAPALGKPVLVLRDTTERPEAIAAGTARLVGTDPDRIVRCAQELLDDEAAFLRMASAQNPYGDGTAATRIASHIQQWMVPRDKAA